MAKRDDPQFRVRLSADLKKKIEICAKNKGRSLNSEIEKRLESTFNDPFFYLLDNDVYEQEIAKAERNLAIWECSLRELPIDADPIERVLTRYEVRKAQHILEGVKRDWEQTLEKKKNHQDSE